MGKEVPKIINDIVEFFQFWQNPDNVKGRTLPIKAFQLRVFDVSMDFVFKWYVSSEELKQDLIKEAREKVIKEEMERMKGKTAKPKNVAKKQTPAEQTSLF